MNEPENIIVTVQTVDESFMRDMELPSELTVSEISKKLLEALKSMPESEFSDWNECLLLCGNMILNSSDTLLNAGVFDGSTITVLEK